MYILGIDTSCDDASAAVSMDDRLLANVSASQVAYHSFWGGVVPSIAKRKHRETIDGVIALALKRSGVTLQHIDLIAVTVGPGLAVALEVGVEKAKQLAKEYGKPVVAVNHMTGHIYASFAKNRNGGYYSTLKSVIPVANNQDPPQGDFAIINNQIMINDQSSNGNFYEASRFDELVTFPLISLLISGNHTELVLMRDHLQYEILGRTKDDALGEAYDKVARMLNLGYPGGPIIEQLARQGDRHALKLPVSMLDGGLNFSYSGLKTAVLRQVQLLGVPGPSLREQFGEQAISPAEYDGYMPQLSTKSTYVLNKQQMYDIAASFEYAAIAQLEYKVRKALERYPEVKFLLLGGGVVGNQYVKKQLRIVCKKFGVHLIYPTSTKLTMDNAGMIAVAGYYLAINKEFADIDSIDRRPGWELS